MCGKKASPPPAVVYADPVADEAKAKALAQQTANATSAQTNRRRVLSGGGMAAQALQTAMVNRAAAQAPSMLPKATSGGG